jgi:peptidoglycan-associated lipoprotein
MRLCRLMTIPLLISCVALPACAKRASTSDAFTASGSAPSGARGHRVTGDGPATGDGAAGARQFMQAATGDGRDGAASRQVGGAAAGSAVPGGTTYRAAGDGAGSAATANGTTVHGTGGADGMGGAGVAGSSAASGAGGASQTGAGGAQAGLNGQSGTDASPASAAGLAAGGRDDDARSGAARTATDGATGGSEQTRGARSVAGFHPVPELGDVHFDYNAYDIRPADAGKLEANARWLRDHPAHVVLIEGHCDERGTQEYNMALGAHRAKATMTYLVSQGVEPTRIELISYGKERPVCTEETDACWSRNRRAHFLVKSQ